MYIWSKILSLTFLILTLVNLTLAMAVHCLRDVSFVFMQGDYPKISTALQRLPFTNQSTVYDNHNRYIHVQHNSFTNGDYYS